MLDISKSERYFILTLLIFGVFCTALLYYQKSVTNSEIKKVEFKEPRIFININTASAAQLERLPGIGPVLAKDIIVYRQRVGGFKEAKELKNVKGIGDKKFEKIKDLLIIQ